MLKFTSKIAALLLLVASCGAAHAASGTAVGVDPDAEARGKQARTLTIGSDIFIGDRVVTDTNGLVQILFDDNTRLVVGPKSSLVIDDYLLRENGSAGKFAINALSGTFRFITGNSKKSSYIIKTPTGQIGVRGTEFDLYIVKKATYLLQLGGSTINCPKSGDCETISGRCDFGVMTSGEVDMADGFSDLSRDDRRMAASRFSLSKSQRALLRPFRVSGAEGCLKDSAQAGPPASISSGVVIRRPKKDDSDKYD